MRPNDEEVSASEGCYLTTLTPRFDTISSLFPQVECIIALRAIEMNSGIKRPPSVWLTQTLLIIFALLWLGILILNVVTLLGTIPEVESIARLVIAFSLIIFFVLLLLVAFYGLARRRMYGKWLGLVSLILIWILIVYTQLFPSTGPYKRYEYDNAAQLAGAFLALSLIHAMFLFLILRLAFSKKVNQFFQSENHITS